MGKIVIAIDGFSGCGKSSTAKAVAKKLGYTYIDSGAMYRAATLHFLNNLTVLSNPKEVSKALNSLKISFHFNSERQTQETFLNGLNVEDEIRTMRVSDYVSEVSKLKEVRHALVAQQQKLGKAKGVVMDGRDIGTAVFPEAELKIFNRWGEEIFFSNDHTASWDGAMSDGTDCPDGVYNYLLEYQEINKGEVQRILGFVHLLR